MGCKYEHSSNWIRISCEESDLEQGAEEASCRFLVISKNSIFFRQNHSCSTSSAFCFCNFRGLIFLPKLVNIRLKEKTEFSFFEIPNCLSCPTKIRGNILLKKWMLQMKENSSNRNFRWPAVCFLSWLYYCEASEVFPASAMSIWVQISCPRA